MKYHHGNLKEELISSACVICESLGHDHMSLRSIAKEAKVSQTAPYRHFKTKEDLLAEVSKKGFEDLAEILNQPTNKNNSMTPKERFIEMGLAYLRFGLERKNTYDLMHSPIINKVEYPELLEAASAAFDELVKIIIELNPGISDDDLGRQCIRHWAQIHGLVGLIGDTKIDESMGTNAGDAMSIVTNDLRSFLTIVLEV
ncbi:MAG: TetR/AcrR family transcriptional regulator [Gammaproteobacteria bacterium]|nr:TetR/AcrR family transcriptional regulator [Gammaproteobacteria bacterium]